MKNDRSDTTSTGNFVSQIKKSEKSENQQFADLDAVSTGPLITPAHVAPVSSGTDNMSLLEQNVADVTQVQTTTGALGQLPKNIIIQDKCTNVRIQ